MAAVISKLIRTKVIFDGFFDKSIHACIVIRLNFMGSLFIEMK